MAKRRASTSLPGALTFQQREFCRAYVGNHGNGTQAAIAAGYAEGSADGQAIRLLDNARVAAEIARLELEAAKRAEVSLDMVIANWRDIVVSDPREIVEAVIDCCRWCHGEGHEYQWRNSDEFQAAVVDWERKEGRREGSGGPEPSDLGGYGFRAPNPPHPDCPMCDGRGVPQVVIKDQRMLSLAARQLLGGVKQSQHGIEIKLVDKMVALDGLAKFVGAYKADNQQKAPLEGLLSEMLDTITTRGSKAAIVTDPEGESR